MFSQRQTDKTGMCLGSFSSKVFQCFFNILTLFGKKEQKYKKESYKSNNIIYKMYTKSHCNTNRKIISSSTPIPATPRWQTVPVFFRPRPSLFSSVSYDRVVHVDNHLDHKVLLDLGVLQTGLVGQELPGEEPPLAGHVNLFVLLQLFLELGDGVRHARCQAHVLS